MRRGLWEELDLADEPDGRFMFHPGWTNDRETLAMGLRETGWYPTTGESFRVAENAELKWGWVGVTEDRTVVICNSEGLAAGTGDHVDDVLQVTLARIGNSG